MADENENGEGAEGAEGATETQAVDYSWMPEQFRPEGKPDTEGFMSRYDELAAFKSQQDERSAAAPKSADEYKLDLPEKIELPEGLTAPEGFEPKIDMDDPDLPAFRALALKHGLSQNAVTDLMQLEAIRTIRGATSANAQHAEEMKALGPDGQARIQTIERQVKAALPDTQAQALVDGIHSADALRALEALMSRNAKAPAGPGGGVDMSKMSVDDKLKLAFEQRKKAS